MKRKHMFCLDCSYDLDGLEDSRCPECGRCFEADDARTFSSSRRRRFWRGVTSIALALVCFVMLNTSFSTGRPAGADAFLHRLNFWGPVIVVIACGVGAAIGSIRWERGINRIAGIVALFYLVFEALSLSLMWIRGCT